MRVLIVDDERPARDRLRKMVETLGAHAVVGEAATGDEALQVAERLSPDVVLMDIRMPGTDGLEAARQMARHNQPPALIFVTAYGDHALRAFEAQAVDYLLKPVRRERLEEALKKARRLNRAQLEALSRDVDPESERDHLLIKRRDGIVLVPLDDIYYLQAEHKYVTVNHCHGEDLIEDSLKQLEEQFPDRLVRIHRNCLVIREQLTGLERSGSGHTAVLRDCNHRPEISRRHLPSVRRFLRTKGE